MSSCDFLNYVIYLGILVRIQKWICHSDKKHITGWGGSGETFWRKRGLLESLGEVVGVASVFFRLGYGDGVHVYVLVKLCTLNMCTLFYVNHIPVKPLKCCASFYLTAVSLELSHVQMLLCFLCFSQKWNGGRRMSWAILLRLHLFLMWTGQLYACWLLSGIGIELWVPKAVLIDTTPFI